MTLCTIVEIIAFTFHSTVNGSMPSSLIFFDILIALQGVVIFIIFVCLPPQCQLIKRWWVATGSLDLQAAEMEALNR